jgi:hypothetical protein
MAKDSVYYQPTLCELCFNKKCGMHNKRILWNKSFSCLTFKTESAWRLIEYLESIDLPEIEESPQLIFNHTFIPTF